MHNQHSDKSDIYFTEKNSEKENIRPGYARVTEILSPWVDFSAIDPLVLENAADRGTRVHKHCENYANLLNLHACSMFDMQAVEQDCKPYVESYIQWFDENVDAVYSCEERLYCDKYKFCGKPDHILHLKGDPENHLTLLDNKTPQTKSKSWELQLGGYEFLVSRYTPFDIQRRGCLMLKKTGKIGRFIEYTNVDSQSMFLNACELYHFFKSK